MSFDGGESALKESNDFPKLIFAHQYRHPIAFLIFGADAESENLAFHPSFGKKGRIRAVSNPVLVPSLMECLQSTFEANGTRALICKCGEAVCKTDRQGQIKCDTPKQLCTSLW